MSESAEKQRVLIVDDTPDNIRILMEALRKDYAIQAATDGEKALNIANSATPPDVILLDVMMPGMDGYEVCDRLKKGPKTEKIPVIFITALTEVKDEAKGLALGAVDYITKPINPALVTARVRNHLELKRHRDNLEKLIMDRTKEMVIRLVLASEARDTDTGAHIKRIRAFTTLLAKKHGLDDEEADLMGLASTMHDLGKIGVPDYVLLKDGKLDDDEWVIMKSHTEIGAKNLAGSKSRLLEVARSIALTHHERWNGSGYPQGLAGEDIPLGGRIVGLVDVFDALTSKRPYKEAWSIESAVEAILNDRGEHFDPDLTDLFLNSVSEFATIREEFQDDEFDPTLGGEHAGPGGSRKSS
jgi:putative two-component system response regulator